MGIFISCTNSHDEVYTPVPTSPVVLDLTQVPYPKLSDYKFFEGDMKNMAPSYGVIPFDPITDLFTDYAEKKRYIWMPKGLKGTYNGDGNILELPVGAAIIKMLYYNNVQPSNTTKIIETRLMIRKSTGWIFAEYVWNADQTDALLQTTRSQIPISWKDENNVIKSINYQIPSVTLDCKRCHQIYTSIEPIGIKPQTMNRSYPYSDGTKNQLTKLVEFGYLENNLPANIVSIVDYKDTSKSLNLRVRSYFDANCSHCHIDGGEADFLSPRFAFNKTDVSANMGVCMPITEPMPGFQNIIRLGSLSDSSLFYRMNTNTTYKMPAIGTTIPHTEGIQLIQDWITSLTTCD